MLKSCTAITKNVSKFRCVDLKEMASDGSFKDQGNQEYKLGNFLKAAGLYTKAIKEDAGNGVLYRCV